MQLGVGCGGQLGALDFVTSTSLTALLHVATAFTSHQNHPALLPQTLGTAHGERV